MYSTGGNDEKNTMMMANLTYKLKYGIIVVALAIIWSDVNFHPAIISNLRNDGDLPIGLDTSFNSNSWNDWQMCHRWNLGEPLLGKSVIDVIDSQLVGYFLLTVDSLDGILIADYQYAVH